MEDEVTSADTSQDADPAAAITAGLRDAFQDMAGTSLGSNEKTAPDAGHAEDAAPASGTPVESEDAEDGATPDEEAKQVGDDSEDTVETVEEIDDNDPELLEALGMDEVPSDDVDTLKARHSEAVREMHAEKQARKEMTDALAAIGREFINTPEGLKLAPTTDAEDIQFGSEQVKAIVEGLSDKELETIQDDAAAGAALIASKIGAEFATRVPPVNASRSDVVLTQAEQNAVWDGMVNAKTESGKPKYPDIASESVVESMDRIIGTMNPKLLDKAQKDPDVRHLVLALAHSKVQLKEQTKQVILSKRKAKAAEQKAKTQKGVVVTGQGSGRQTKAQSVNGNADGNDVLAGMQAAARELVGGNL